MLRRTIVLIMLTLRYVVFLGLKVTLINSEPLETFAQIIPQTSKSRSQRRKAPRVQNLKLVEVDLGINLAQLTSINKNPKQLIKNNSSYQSRHCVFESLNNLRTESDHGNISYLSIPIVDAILICYYSRVL